MEEESINFMIPVVEAIGLGGCPTLKKLELWSVMVPQVGCALIGALSFGHLHHLEDLTLQGDEVQDNDVFMGIIEALRSGSWPNLSRLYLDFPGVTDGNEHARILGQAFASRVFPRLRTLNLKGYLGDAGVACLIEGLLAGGSTISSLAFGGSGMGPEGARSVVRAVSSIITIERVFLNQQPSMGDGHMADVIKALGTACPGMQWFSACTTGMGSQAGEALLQVLREGRWRHLSYLAVSENPDLGDAIVGFGLAQVIASGTLPQLSSLYISGCGLREEGAEHLVEAFKQGSCRGISFVEVGESKEAIEEGGFEEMDDPYGDQPGLYVPY